MVRPGSVLELGQLVGAVSGLWCVCVRVCVCDVMQNICKTAIHLVKDIRRIQCVHGVSVIYIK